MNKEKIITNLEEALRLLREYEFEHPPKQEEEERPDLDGKNAKLLWYPLAKTDVTPMKTRGKYRKWYPEGAVVHFTAGRSLNGVQDAVNTSNYGVKQGYTYFTIASDGTIIQPFSLEEWGSHAGTSEWAGLGSGVSQYLVGIEVCCAGKLDSKMTSWFGEQYDEKQVLYSEKIDNIQKGFYHKYTDAQKKALLDLLLWLKHNNENVFSFSNVVGHDEVAPNRKNDPGASLGCTMPQFREFLKAEYEKKYKV